MNNKSSQSERQSNCWLYAKSIALIAISISIAFRVYDTSIKIAMDTPTLLSILLALFSVGLSAMFYFKATDTSNKFYDNSYKYTKDIAELLVKIESGFGERLKNLDEGYSSMRDHIQNGRVFDKDIKETKSNLKAEQGDLEKTRREKEELMKKLFESSKLQKEEKETLAAELELKEKSLKESQREVARLNRRLFAERIEKREHNDDLSRLRRQVDEHTLYEVIPKLEGLDEMGIRTFNEEMSLLIPSLHEDYLRDLEILKYFSSKTGKFTRMGRNYIRSFARNN